MITLVKTLYYTVCGKEIQESQKEDGHNKPVNRNRHNECLISGVHNDNDNDDGEKEYEYQVQEVYRRVEMYTEEEGWVDIDQV